MRKFLAATLAGVTFAGAVATAADARPRHYRHHNGGNDDEVAAAIIGGVAGLALGAALSNSGNRSRAYYSNGYSNGYAYAPSNGYAYAPSNGYSYAPAYDGYYGDYYAAPPRPVYRERTCITRDHVYDRYVGRNVVIERRYPC